MKNILLTGGAGFIGNHTCIELLQSSDEYNIIVIDNLCNSTQDGLNKIEKLLKKKIVFYEYDLLNKKDINKIFIKHNIYAVIHFAGLKAVGESVEKPLYYYQNNITGTLNLLEVMKKHNCYNMIFSSSATVYGSPDYLPIDEKCSLHPTNPYGMTKLHIEQILDSVYQSDKNMNIVILRYFNPVGAHSSGIIGENPKDIPNNLFPYVMQITEGRRECLSVFGNDYDTPDGTGVRDYIHVVDLAQAHVKSLEFIINSENKEIKKINVVEDTVKGLFEIFNIGTGIGYSVLDIVKAYEKASKLKVPYKVVDRRPGDIGTCYSDPTKANKMLKWKAKYNLEQMCKDANNFIQKNR